MARCAGITAAGGRCKGQAISNREFCFSHDPDHAEARKLRASKGGRRGGRGRPQAELSDIKDRLRTMVEDVRNGAMDRADAAVCGQLYNTLIRAVSVELKVREIEDLARQVEELSELLDARNEGGRRWG